MLKQRQEHIKFASIGECVDGHLHWKQSRPLLLWLVRIGPPG
ncbi:hypothetical protein D187_009495 [Cystobacter fuscus DSM 2262]|uniref:Uncharacterized protein n=1 Tax=Cystobacter fuscus (strain ATCC 25194 / DSM 2262 / NBRC 100088 / M29) TaxID=1242864 RepID=S9NWK4_CYSF2|nr:hypothetical protein D187_009495 [Cystobacter fuscus DSM 2262]